MIATAPSFRTSPSIPGAMQVRPLVATWRPLSPATRITTAAPAERVSLRHGTAIAPAGSRLLPARRPSAAAASHGAGDAAAEHYDVVIIGSGPVGSAFARKLVAGGQHVCMVDAGPRTSSKPGAHLKNAYKYQRDVNKFADHIRGALQTLSVPTNFASVPTLDPLAFNPPPTAKGYVRGNQNPYQSQQDNLPAAAATYNVGGMGTHWTCSCPRPTEIERNWLFPSDEAYSEAENILRVNQKAFLNYSIRDRTLNSVLRKAWRARTGTAGRHRGAGIRALLPSRPLGGPGAYPHRRRRPQPMDPGESGAAVARSSAPRCLRVRRRAPQRRLPPHRRPQVLRHRVAAV